LADFFFVSGGCNRKEDLLLLLIRGDPVCEALVRRLAEADNERNQVQVLSDENTEQHALESMEHRLEAFRKMVCPFLVSGRLMRFRC
jgi:hypothetical protein